LTSDTALPFWLQQAAAMLPHSPGMAEPRHERKRRMTDTAIYDRIAAQIEPFNKKGVALTESTTFASDLEWDSLTVMDFVAAIEDEFDIIITMNMQAEIETVGQLVAAVEKLTA
jgi:acyl carrier protein